MKATSYISLVVFFLFTFSGYSQLKTVLNKTTYPFWINVPKGEDDVKQPLLLFLHGKSLTGTDINRVRRYGVLYAMDRGKKIPAIVVAPQLPSGSWNPDKVLEVVEYVKKNYPIDTERIYVCGMSLGAYGTMHFAGKHADKITAAVAICGGGNESDACRLSTIPIWLQHGDVDYIVHMKESQKMYDAIKKCDSKADVTFTVIKGGNHGNVERLFHQDAIYDWLFKQVRKPAVNELIKQ